MSSYASLAFFHFNQSSIHSKIGREASIPDPVLNAGDTALALTEFMV